jgi:excisionase family DNA binding protein
MTQQKAWSEGRILFPVREAAFFLGISPRKICYLIAAGELKPTRIGRRTLLHRAILEGFARGDHPTRRAGDQGAAPAAVEGARGGAK